jgi:hypothetical protein
MSTYNELSVSYKKKFQGFLMDVWPSIYTMLNDFLRGLVGFLKDVIGSVFG